MVEVIFAVFAIATLLLFRFFTQPTAVAITCLAGWVVLPVGNFPTGSSDALVPYWIIGTALPSDMLLTKMWWPPVAALAGKIFRAERNRLLDL